MLGFGAQVENGFDVVFFSERLAVLNGCFVGTSTAIEDSGLQTGFGGGMEVIDGLVDVAEIEN